MLMSFAALPGAKISSHVTTTSNLYDELTAAKVQPVSENEILIWNIKGTNEQPGGSESAKMGVVVLQNGYVISNACGTKKAASKAAPVAMTPGTAWTNGTWLSIVNGYYAVSWSGTYYCGVGNTIEFIQIPYDTGWNV